MSSILLNDLVSVVEKSSPAVASAILGPAGGMVVSLLENLFGVKSDSLSATISTDPQSAEKIKQLELQHSTEIANINSQEYASEIQDRINARSINKSDIFLHSLALVYSLAFFGYLSLDILSKGAFDKDIFHDLLNVAMLILSFYFGSAYKRQ